MYCIAGNGEAKEKQNERPLINEIVDIFKNYRAGAN